MNGTRPFSATGTGAMKANFPAAIGSNGGASASSGILSPKAHELLNRALMLNEEYEALVTQLTRENAELRKRIWQLEGVQEVLDFACPDVGAGVPNSAESRGNQDRQRGSVNGFPVGQASRFGAAV